jgi:hypothetical protein
MTTASRPKSRKKIHWAPYILILPSLIYLALFFAWPMVQGLVLAVREEGALLTFRSDADSNSLGAGQLPRGTQVNILDQQGNQIPPEEPAQDDLLTEVWFRVRGESTGGQVIEGWTPERRIRVRESDANGVPIAGTVRSILSSSADPLTRVYAEADEGSEVVGQMRHELLLKFWIRQHWKFGFRSAGKVGIKPPKAGFQLATSMFWEMEHRLASKMETPASLQRGISKEWLTIVSSGRLSGPLCC